VQHKENKLLVTDGAPYMVKAGSNLKVHLTWLAHVLNLVCETIRKQYPDVNEIEK
jgi:hypothetical protein